MSYLLDKKIARKRNLKAAILALVFLFLFYFRAGVYSGLSATANVIFHPFFSLGNNVNTKFENLSFYFNSKKSLLKENSDLSLKLAWSGARVSNYESILAENEKLKEILGRKNEKLEMILSTILAQNNQSLYNTLVVDTGST
ncbi:MAG: hypothetical protein KA515_01665, partial [Candidatus Pacebacteria bacterium]|nr:hypothetical protein [Candidatus Paceibacterota bacterium]